MNILRGFDGILQVDGYTGHDALGDPRRVGGKSGVAPFTLQYSGHADIGFRVEAHPGDTAPRFVRDRDHLRDRRRNPLACRVHMVAE